MISANPEPLDDDDELELPRPPAVLADDPLAPVPDDPDADEPEPEEFEELVLEFEPADTSSPGLVLWSDTIVPVAGAYSRVSARSA